MQGYKIYTDKLRQNKQTFCHVLLLTVYACFPKLLKPMILSLYAFQGLQHSGKSIHITLHFTIPFHYKKAKRLEFVQILPCILSLEPDLQQHV